MGKGHVPRNERFVCILSLDLDIIYRLASPCSGLTGLRQAAKYRLDSYQR
jgi:hypothetical protein